MYRSTYLITWFEKDYHYDVYQYMTCVCACVHIHMCVYIQDYHYMIMLIVYMTCVYLRVYLDIHAIYQNCKCFTLSPIVEQQYAFSTQCVRY